MRNINIFTDGACSANGKINAKAGIGIHFPEKIFEDVSKPFNLKPITNQRAELYAIYSALKIVEQELQQNNVIIYSDSKYSINCVTNWIKNWEKKNWVTSNNKPVKNLDLIVPISDFLNKYSGKIQFKHVLAHTKKEDYASLGNDIADKLATSAISK